jgi:chemotaxis protein CheX
MTSASREVDGVAAYGKYLDESVQEVFGLMMGMECASVADCPLNEPETISAVIGLAGAMSGTCVLRSGEKVALRMAEALTGAPMTEIDATVKDAVGEICNMVAGAWKGKQPMLASECMLSTPTVVTGTNYQLHTQKPSFRMERFYQFEQFSFGFTLVCEAVQ